LTWCIACYIYIYIATLSPEPSNHKNQILKNENLSQGALRVAAKGHTEGVPELDQAIENALTPFGFKITGTNLDLGMRDLLFEADEFELPVKD